MLCVTLNIIMIATQHENQGDFWSLVLDIQNITFVIVFTLEMLIKLIAFGISGYLQDNWNRFDGIIGVPQMILVCC